MMHSQAQFHKFNLHQSVRNVRKSYESVHGTFCPAQCCFIDHRHKADDRFRRHCTGRRRSKTALLTARTAWPRPWPRPKELPPLYAHHLTHVSVNTPARYTPLALSYRLLVLLVFTLASEHYLNEHLSIRSELPTRYAVFS